MAEVPAGRAQTFSISLERGQSIFVDVEHAGSIAQSGDETGTTASLALCDASGAVLAPSPGEVFAKGASYSAIDTRERLRFTAPLAGSYTVALAPRDSERDVIVRHRSAGDVVPAIVAAQLGRRQNGVVSSSLPATFSFAGQKGQWVEISATSDSDTVLRVAGPSRNGTYSIIAENDDSNGLNPVVRVPLRRNGTYYVQLDSLAEAPNSFALSLNTIAPPAAAATPAPTTLRLDQQVTGRMNAREDMAVYSLPVVAGSAYEIDVTAPFDAALAIAVASPIESDNGSSDSDAGLAIVRTVDTGTSGVETLSFTARSNGAVLVRVSNFGIEDGNGEFTLIARDLGN